MNWKANNVLKEGFAKGGGTTVKIKLWVLIKEMFSMTGKGHDSDRDTHRAGMRREQHWDWDRVVSPGLLFSAGAA